MALGASLGTWVISLGSFAAVFAVTAIGIFLSKRASLKVLLKNKSEDLVGDVSTNSVVQAHDMQRDAFQHFEQLHANAPEAARALVRKWATRQAPSDAKALAVLGHRASDGVLEDLFDCLSVELKQACCKMISTPFNKQALSEGLQYMSRQVVEQYRKTRPALPASTLAVIDSVSEREFLAIAEANPEMGAMIFSVLPTARVASFINAMPSGLFTALSANTGRVFEKDTFAEAAKIEGVIHAARERQVKRLAFLEKSAELIRAADTEKEVILYRMLIQVGDIESVRATALKSIPGSLVTKVPPHFIQNILTRMTTTDRAELIAAQNPTRAEFLLECLGQPGTRMRELVEMDVEKITADESRVDALREDGEVLWLSLVSALRRIQTRDLSFAYALKPIVNRWVNDLARYEAPLASEGQDLS